MSHASSDARLDSFATFGELLRYLRRRARLTQRELGQAVGYTDAHITRIEAGECSPPDPTTVQARFVEALGLERDGAAAMRLVALAAERDGTYAEEATPVAASVVQSVKSPLTNLPAQLTRFIGREREIAEVKSLLRENRLVTLTGSGGVGKTRLALEVAETLVRLRSAQPGLPGMVPFSVVFPDGMWLAELAPLADPSLLPGTVAAAFGLRPMSQPATTVLLDHLRDRQALLLLDNCEHQVQACAELAEMLLSNCPRLQILATSREALNVPGEATWRVPSLSAGEATWLFVERARGAKSGFALSEQNAAAIARICERLDGMPLAIELAAARLRTFSVEQVAARLDDRFQLLASGWRTAPPRHQTLRATVDWSYGLLSEAEQRLLRWLSVFSGGWDIEAAEGVWGGVEVLNILDQLVNKSLVLVDDADGRVAEPRYRLLETIRQYAHEKLIEAGEHDLAHWRHADFVADLAQRAKPHLRGPSQYTWYDRLEADTDNVRAALEWTAQNGAWQVGERIIDGIWWFWFRCGHWVEGQRWTDANLLQPAGVKVHARTLGKLVWLNLAYAGGITDMDKARSMTEEVLKDSYSLKDNWMTLTAEYGIALFHPDLGRRIALLQDALRHAQQLGWKWEEALISGLLSWSLTYVDSRQAESAVTYALQMFTELGDRSHVGWMQRELGVLALRRGDYEVARRHCEESIATYSSTRDQGLAAGYSLLAVIAVMQGDTITAKQALQACIPTFLRWGNRPSTCVALVLAGCVAEAEGCYDRAVQILAAVTAADETYTEPSLINTDASTPQLYERCLAALHEDVDMATFDRRWAEGLRMTLQQAVTYALRSAEGDELSDR